MAISDIQKFRKTFPFWADHIAKWTPLKDGVIKVELDDRQYFIFTYTDERHWRLETARSYLKAKKQDI